MDFGRLQRGEYIGFVGVGILLASLFLTWFETSPDNENAQINGETGEFNAFDTYGTLDWLLVAACLAPFILAWIVIRSHEVGWNRGELTAILGFSSLLLVILNGIILGQPGTVEVSLQWGYPVAVLASVGILMSGALRQYEAMEKQPPGV